MVVLFIVKQTEKSLGELSIAINELIYIPNQSQSLLC